LLFLSAPRPVVDLKLARELFLATAKAHLGPAASAAASAGVSSDIKAEQLPRKR
jgi:hypothetical protein